MEPLFVFSQQGQEIEQFDILQWAQNAALADDRVFQELFRLSAFTGGAPARGITAPGNQATAFGNGGAIVQPNGAAGSVLVNPFRAYLGPFANDTPTHALRDTRSAVAIGANTMQTTQPLAANASGVTQLDLIYAVFALDASAATVQRYVKSNVPPYDLIPGNVVTLKQSKVTIGVVTGTVSSPPVLPSDSGSNYYIPLVYVRKPNGFNGSSTVAKTDIQDAAPVLHIGQNAGVMAMRPAHAQNAFGVDGGGKWSGTGPRAETYVSPLQVGGKIVQIKLALVGGSGIWSHQSGDMIDDLSDWRNREFLWFVNGALGSAALDYGSNAAGVSTERLPDANPLTNVSSQRTFGFGQSFVADGTVILSGGSPPAFPIALALTSNTNGNAINLFGNANCTVALYVDGSGVLRLFVNGLPQTRLSIFLMSCAEFPGF